MPHGGAAAPWQNRDGGEDGPAARPGKGMRKPGLRQGHRRPRQAGRELKGGGRKVTGEKGMSEMLVMAEPRSQA